MLFEPILSMAAEGAARVSKFKKLGLALSEQLSRSDVERLKHLVSDHIPQGKAEGIENGLQLLKALEQKDIVNARDVSVLIDIFEKIRRNDLVLKIEEYVVGIKKESDSKELGQAVMQARRKGDLYILNRMLDQRCASVPLCLPY